MTATTSDEMRSTSGASRRARASSHRGQRPSPRTSQYMIAPAGPGLTQQTLIDRLNRVAGVEIVRTCAARGTLCPPIAVVLMSDENAAALRRSAGDTLVIEPNRALRAAASAGVLPRPPMTALMNALSPGFTATIRVVNDSGQPVERAEVLLVGEQWAAQGLTDRNGQVELALYGELPETVTELIVRPCAGYWGQWRERPELQANGTYSVTVEPLSPDEPDWGGGAMRFDLLPAECRGAGVKIALVDTGVTTSHPQLAKIDHGIDVRSGDTSSWSQDAVGHGTPCASIISAAPDAGRGVRGYAPEAELHVCRLPPDARCSDLVAALDHCLQTGIDLVCLGFGCEHGSAVVEQRIAVANQQGIGIIAAAGNSGGSVQFPASSPLVLAVGAIGEAASVPNDSPQAALADAAGVTSGPFVPPFSCRGPELDLCAPGVAIVACQSSDGYAACDGTSLAAAHVAALAALILAHHSDFRADFAGRDFRRVERLFQILKDTAQPLGHPWLTGAGLPDAARALGLPSQLWPFVSPLNAGLGDMRNAIRHIDLVYSGAGFAPGVEAAAAFEPARGPANVTRLPLNPLPLTLMTGTGAEAGVQALKAAMMVAGLTAAGR
jgi:subtilisin